MVRIKLLLITTKVYLKSFLFEMLKGKSFLHFYIKVYVWEIPIFPNIGTKRNNLKHNTIQHFEKRVNLKYREIKYEPPFRHFYRI